jgi:poly(A) polymerase
MNRKSKVIPRADHRISRKHIDTNALKVLYRLEKSGYDAYLVGGCVRDLLLHHIPKDFDVVTNASPEEVRKIFRNCRLIGRRFRLAHVFFRDGIVEVATFRAGHQDAQPQHGRSKDGMIVRDNVYGSIEEDAWRRDFTLNALYYNIKDFSIIDFTNGYQDLINKKLRVLGDPETRYREDPVRMLRAVRIAAKLDLKITPQSATPIKALAHLLKDISSSRLFDETIKLFHTGHAQPLLPLLYEHHLFGILFPTAEQLLHDSLKKQMKLFLEVTCRNTDTRIASGKSVSCAFLFGFLLWMPVEQRCLELQEEGLPPMEALQLAGREILHEQTKITALPKRFVGSIYDIWHLQYQLPRLKGKSIYRCLENPRFRAGYDLLLMRAEIDPTLEPLAQWWTHFQQAKPNERKRIIAKL